MVIWPVGQLINNGFWSVGQSIGQWVSYLVSIGQSWSVSLVMWSLVVSLGSQVSWSFDHLINNGFLVIWSINWPFGQSVSQYWLVSPVMFSQAPDHGQLGVWSVGPLASWSVNQ